MGGTILVVDDDDRLRQSFRRELTRRGYRVLLSHDRVSAIYTAQREAIDFAIIDQRLAPELGDRSGLEVAVEILLVRPKIRIVVLTGYPSSHAAFDAGRCAGIVDYVQKPATVDQIISGLEGSPVECDTPRLTLEQIQREYARRVVEECDGNLTHAAKLLRVTRATVRRLLDG